MRSNDLSLPCIFHRLIDIEIKYDFYNELNTGSSSGAHQNWKPGLAASVVYHVDSSITADDIVSNDCGKLKSTWNIS